jgi:hypothetical protein
MAERDPLNALCSAALYTRTLANFNSGTSYSEQALAQVIPPGRLACVL